MNFKQLVLEGVQKELNGVYIIENPKLLIPKEISEEVILSTNSKLIEDKEKCRAFITRIDIDRGIINHGFYGENTIYTQGLTTITFEGKFIANNLPANIIMNSFKNQKSVAVYFEEV